MFKILSPLLKNCRVDYRAHPHVSQKQWALQNIRLKFLDQVEIDMKELPEELMCGSTLWFMTSTRAATNSAGPTMEIINIKESLRRSETHIRDSSLSVHY
jgi:hypothetical protein